MFAFLTLTFIALAIGWLSDDASSTNSNSWIHLGGWLGLITALLAWYASFAGVTNATFKRTVFPTLPR